MHPFFKILIHRVSTVGIDYLGEVVLGAVTEYRRSRREGHFDTFRKQENEPNHNQNEEGHSFEDRY